MAFSRANTTSLLEKATTLSFPVEDSVKSKIPLWMNFYCFEYSNTATTRALSNSTVGGFLKNNFPNAALKAQIVVPAPINYESTTSHIYQNNQTSATTILPPAMGNYLGDTIKNIPLLGMLPQLQGIVSNVMDTVNSFAGEWTGLASDIPADNNDAVYTPSGPSRVFEIKLFMPCLSEADSTRAGSIIRAFEAYSLPTLQSVLSPTNTTFFHPPLWIFGIGDINGKMDADWSGQPLLSALMTVKSRRVAFDANSLAAVGSIFKPVGYSVALVFKEIEPAVRLTSPLGLGGNGTTITNRSGAIIRGGVNSY